MCKLQFLEWPLGVIKIQFCWVVVFFKEHDIPVDLEHGGLEGRKRKGWTLTDLKMSGIAACLE